MARQAPKETKMTDHGGAFPQNAGGWAKKDLMSEFVVKKNSAISDPLPSMSNSSRSGFPPSNSPSSKPNETRSGSGAPARGERYEPVGLRFRRDDWICRNCGHQNTTGRVCVRCRKFGLIDRTLPSSRTNAQNLDPRRSFQSPTANAQDLDPGRSWRHMKFIKAEDAEASNHSIDPNIKNTLDTISQSDRSREERLTQSKDGRFVGFTTRAAAKEATQAAAAKEVSANSPDSPRPVGFTITRHPSKEDLGFSIRHKPRGRDGTASTQDVSGYPRARERRRSNSVFEHMDDEDADLLDMMEGKRQRKKERAARKLAGSRTPIILPEHISIANLAIAMRVPIEQFGAKMRDLGFEETNYDHILDAETAGLIASEFNFEPTTPTVASNESRDICARPPVEDKSLLPLRPPVVTIMGHVDHGKTTLLDWLRKSSVAASEFGGITQHIGAFSVSMPSGRLITFLDTPGHAAFLSMRQRGANVTDMVILVVAADDSVKPQTLEALKHAQAAKVPIIVAVNKVDKEVANVDQVKRDLAQHGVEIEEYGGDTQVVPVSGKTGQGMVELEEAVIALADLLDVRAETDGAAEGWILEATQRKGGKAATVLVSRGTIRPGDVIVAGSTWAKARTLRDASGARLKAAGPGTPVEIEGWRELPKAGDQVLQADNEQRAKLAVDYRIGVAAREQMAANMATLNETRRAEQEKREQKKKEEEGKQQQQQQQQEEEGQEEWIRGRAVGEEGKGSGSEMVKSQPGIKEVFFIIKADASGSVEAVLDSVSALGNSEVRPQIIRSGVGPVTEFDIDYVATVGGHILSFNTPLEPSMMHRALQAGVKIMNHNVIYRLVDDAKAQLSEQLSPLITYPVLGEAEIAQIFEINVKRRVFVRIAGCKVRNGAITRNGKVRVMRDGKMIYDGMTFIPTFFFLLIFFYFKRRK